MSTLLELTGKEHTSYSALTTYLDCGEKFRLQRVLGVEEDPAYYLAGGNAVHHASEVYDKLIDEGADYAAAVHAAQVAFTTDFNNRLDERPNANWRAGGRATAANPNKEDAQWWLQSGPEQVLLYAQWRRGTDRIFRLWRDPEDNLAVELEVLPEFVGGVKIKGYIDRVFRHVAEDELVVVDLKSGKNKPTSALQLGLYATAVEQKYGVRPKYGAYFMTRTGSLGNLEPLEKYTEKMIARQFRDFKKGVEAELFVPHLTMMCGSCGVRSSCYAYSPEITPPDFDSDLNVTSTQGASA